MESLRAVRYAASGAMITSSFLYDGLGLLLAPPPQVEEVSSPLSNKRLC